MTDNIAEEDGNVVDDPLLMRLGPGPSLKRSASEAELEILDEEERKPAAKKSSTNAFSFPQTFRDCWDDVIDLTDSTSIEAVAGDDRNNNSKLVSSPDLFFAEHPDLAKIYSWVEQYKGKFCKPVIGPLALVVKASSSLVATALETHVPDSLWEHFVVQSHEDLELLRDGVREELNLEVLVFNADDEEDTIIERPLSDETFQLVDEGFGMTHYLDEYLVDCPAVVRKMLNDLTMVKNVVVLEIGWVNSEEIPQPLAVAFNHRSGAKHQCYFVGQSKRGEKFQYEFPPWESAPPLSKCLPEPRFIQFPATEEPKSLHSQVHQINDEDAFSGTNAVPACSKHPGEEYANAEPLGSASSGNEHRMKTCPQESSNYIKNPSGSRDKKKLHSLKLALSAKPKDISKQFTLTNAASASKDGEKKFQKAKTTTPGPSTDTAVSYKSTDVVKMEKWLLENSNQFEKPILGPMSSLIKPKSVFAAAVLEKHVPENVWASFLAQSLVDYHRLTEAKVDLGLSISVFPPSQDDCFYVRPFEEVHMQHMQDVFGLEGYLDDLLEISEKEVLHFLYGEQFGLDDILIGSGRTELDDRGLLKYMSRRCEGHFTLATANSWEMVKFSYAGEQLRRESILPPTHFTSGAFRSPAVAKPLLKDDTFTSLRSSNEYAIPIDLAEGDNESYSEGSDGMRGSEKPFCFQEHLVDCVQDQEATVVGISTPTSETNPADSKLQVNLSRDANNPPDLGGYSNQEDSAEVQPSACDSDNYRGNDRGNIGMRALMHASFLDSTSDTDQFQYGGLESRVNCGSEADISHANDANLSTEDPPTSPAPHSRPSQSDFIPSESAANATSSSNIATPSLVPFQQPRPVVDATSSTFLDQQLFSYFTEMDVSREIASKCDEIEDNKNEETEESSQGDRVEHEGMSANLDKDTKAGMVDEMRPKVDDDGHFVEESDVDEKRNPRESYDDKYKEIYESVDDGKIQEENNATKEKHGSEDEPDSQNENSESEHAQSDPEDETNLQGENTENINSASGDSMSLQSEENDGSDEENNEAYSLRSNGERDILDDESGVIPPFDRRGRCCYRSSLVLFFVVCTGFLLSFFFVKYSFSWENKMGFDGVESLNYKSITGIFGSGSLSSVAQKMNEQISHWLNVPEHDPERKATEFLLDFMNAEAGEVHAVIQEVEHLFTVSDELSGRLSVVRDWFEELSGDSKGRLNKATHYLRSQAQFLESCLVTLRYAISVHIASLYLERWSCLMQAREVEQEGDSHGPFPMDDAKNMISKWKAEEEALTTQIADLEKAQRELLMTANQDNRNAYFW